MQAIEFSSHDDPMWLSATCIPEIVSSSFDPALEGPAPVVNEKDAGPSASGGPLTPIRYCVCGASGSNGRISK